MSEVNYGPFKADKFDSFTTGNAGLDAKVKKGEQVTRKEQLFLGKKLSKLEKKSIRSILRLIAGVFSKKAKKKYQIDRAERYLGVLQSKKISQLKTTLQARNIKLSKNLEDTLQSMANSTKVTQGEFSSLLSDISSFLATPEKDPTTEKTEQVAQQVMTFSSLEVHKAKSGASQKNMMANLLNLNVVSDTPNQTIEIHGKQFYPKTLSAVYKENNAEKKVLMENSAEKKVLMAKHLPLEMASQISTQAKKYPVMNAAVQEIRQNLEQWDGLVLKKDEDGLSNLKQKLAKQFKSLGALSDIISSVTTSEEDSAALALVHPSQSYPTQNVQQQPSTSLITHLVDHYMSGKEDLSSQANKQIFGAVLKRVIHNAKADLPKNVTKAGLQESRKQAPVTTKAIQKTAELHKAVRKGKAWAMQQLLRPMGSSANQVFILKEPKRVREPIAFFKVGAGGEKAAGVMEVLMWNISVIMGIEGMLVPACLTEVCDYKDFEYFEDKGTEKVKDTRMVRVWTKEGELVKRRVVQIGRRGGIQPAQEGMVLYNYMDYPEERTGTIPKSEIVKATGVSLVFGMFDAHGGNIIITKDSEIRYFDNTKSFPNSNGMINRGGGIFSSYRSSLLDLPESHEQLLPAEIDQLKRQVAGYKGKIEGLKKFLDSPQTQAQLKQLPPGWMNQESSIAAMEERVNLMENALASGKVKTLQDLVVLSNPGYKFAFVLELMNLAAQEKEEKWMNKSPETIMQSVHTGVGLFVSDNSFDKNVTQSANSGYDVELIKSWCDDTKLSLEDVIKKIQLHYNQLIATPPTPNEIQGRILGAKRINQELYSNAAYDYKDRDRKTCENLTRGVNTQEFKQNGVPFLESQDVLSSLSWALAKNNDIQLMRSLPDGKHYVTYKTPTGFRVKDVDIQSNPGMVKADGKEVPVKDFISSLMNEGPPKFDDVPALNAFEASEMLKDAPERSLQFRKSADNKTLIVAHKSGGKVEEYRFLPGMEPGKFQLRGKEVSISEITDLVKDGYGIQSSKDQ